MRGLTGFISFSKRTERVVDWLDMKRSGTATGYPYVQYDKSNLGIRNTNQVLWWVTGSCRGFRDRCGGFSHFYKVFGGICQGFRDRQFRPADVFRNRKPRMERAVIMQPRRALK